MSLTPSGIVPSLRRWARGLIMGKPRPKVAIAPDGSFAYYGVRVSAPSGSALADLVSQHGYYERANAWVLTRLVEPNSWFLDVGANIGLMSIPVLAQCPTATVVSFEPSPNSSAYLGRTIADSAFRARWSMVAAAVGAQCGTVSFFVGSEANGVYDGTRDTGRGGGKKPVEIPATTLDVEWERRGKPRVSVIKIDVEGGELNVIRGAGACIGACRPSVLLEWNAENLAAHGVQPPALLGEAAALGYRVFSAPELVPVIDAAHLRLLMTRTESFVLCPRQPEAVS